MICAYLYLYMHDIQIYTTFIYTYPKNLLLVLCQQLQAGLLCRRAVSSQWLHAHR